MSDFRPSDVALAVPPLIATMEKSEREFAAALIVRACHVEGDTWQPIALEKLGRVIESDLAEKRDPVASLARNPFFRPRASRSPSSARPTWAASRDLKVERITKPRLS
jgi:hypothetical protein